MNRQKDIIMLFDFLIELIKEKNNVVETTQETTINTNNPIEQVKKTKNDIGGTHIQDLEKD